MKFTKMPIVGAFLDITFPTPGVIQVYFNKLIGLGNFGGFIKHGSFRNGLLLKKGLEFVQGYHGYEGTKS
ncbi:hypothetical protein SAMN05216436_113122 [bacterium A37T11]|nr:hypothetical protein SAMN05216436_113122 [bacterium A37T11]